MDKSIVQIQHQCRVCLHETNHRILHTESVVKKYEYSFQEAEQYGDTHQNYYDYKLIKCLGCDDVRLNLIIRKDYLGQYSTRSIVYPPDQVRQMPEWVYLDLHYERSLLLTPDQNPGLPEFVGGLRKLLTEVYLALGTKSHRLAMMGIRALVEQIMVFECSDRHSFKQNIKAFFEKGHVAVSQQQAFQDALIEAGHAAMHRGWAPTRDDVTTLLDVIESLIKSLYIDPKKIGKVAKSIPPRAWPPKKPKVN